MRTSVLAFSAIALAAGSAYAALAPLSTFGAGNPFPTLNDGWRAPGEVIPGDTAGTTGTPTAGQYNYLQTANNERGLSYNPVTGNLILVSRSTAGNGIRVLDPVTGADKGFLNQGSGVITGGTFVVNMVDVAADGAIYVGNLSTSNTAAFKVYRWGSETDAAPTVAFNAATGLTRTGDSFAVVGSGASTKFAAAGTNNVTASNFAVGSLDGSNSFTAYTSVAGTTTTSNDYRLALYWTDSDTLIGNQGGNARITDVIGSTATVTGSIPLGAAQRAMDYAVIGGIPLLAVLDSNSGLLQIFDVTNPAAPVLFDQGNNTFGAAANANASGDVEWGAIVGNTATLYAMNTNQGIQAFSFAIPEPGALSLLGLGALGLLRRRRA